MGHTLPATRGLVSDQRRRATARPTAHVDQARWNRSAGCTFTSDATGSGLNDGTSSSPFEVAELVEGWCPLPSGARRADKRMRKVRVAPIIDSAYSDASILPCLRTSARTRTTIRRARPSAVHHFPHAAVRVRFAGVVARHHRHVWVPMIRQTRRLGGGQVDTERLANKPSDRALGPP